MSNHNAGYYSEVVAADSRRKEFNIKNHSLMYSNQKPDFIFAGDSITHFWELNAYFRNPNLFIINRGIAGDNTTYLRKRFLPMFYSLNRNIVFWTSELMTQLIWREIIGN